MKRIENEEARQVCFTKRRAGMFKKAAELSILCGVEIGIVVFSPTGKPFSFGHPSLDYIMRRFLSGGGNPHDIGIGIGAPQVIDGMKLQCLNNEHALMAERLEEGRRRRAKLEEEMSSHRVGSGLRFDMEHEMGVEELESFKKALELLRSSMAGRRQELEMLGAVETKVIRGDAGAGWLGIGGGYMGGYNGLYLTSASGGGFYSHGHMERGFPMCG